MIRSGGLTILSSENPKGMKRKLLLRQLELPAMPSEKRTKGEPGGAGGHRHTPSPNCLVWSSQMQPLLGVITMIFCADCWSLIHRISSCTAVHSGLPQKLFEVICFSEEEASRRHSEQRCALQFCETAMPLLLNGAHCHSDWP